MRGQYAPFFSGAFSEGRSGRVWLGADGVAVASYDDTFRTQLATFIRLRGSDKVATPPGNVPRTTVGDVQGLAAYWSDALARGATKSPSALALLMGPIAAIMDTQTPGDLGGLDGAVRSWRAEMYWLQRLAAPDAPPAAIYTRNAELWHAMMRVATELALIHEAPTKWDLATQALQTSIEKLPGRLATGTKYVLVAAGIVGAAVLLGELAMAGATAHKER